MTKRSLGELAANANPRGLRVEDFPDDVRANIVAARRNRWSVQRIVDALAEDGYIISHNPVRNWLRDNGTP